MFCRRILQTYVDKCGYDFSNDIERTVEKIVLKEEDLSKAESQVIEKKKARVGGLVNPNKK